MINVYKWVVLLVNFGIGAVILWKSYASITPFLRIGIAWLVLAETLLVISYINKYYGEEW